MRLLDFSRNAPLRFRIIKMINFIFMSIKKEIKAHIDSQPEAKRSDMQALHSLIQKVMPKGKLWFLDGKDARGKIVSNPNIGYGAYIIKYADGTSREFYQVGLSANTSGLSVYIMGLDDKKYLAETYGRALGKASVTSYCIKFKALKDINIHVLEAAIKDRLERDHNLNNS